MTALPRTGGDSQRWEHWAIAMAIFDVPQRFSRQWVAGGEGPQMDSTDSSHAMFHEAATRGWDEDELRQLARMWTETRGAADGRSHASVTSLRV